MSKQLLIETRMNSLSLVEGIQPKKGYLGTLAGACADFVNPTRNNNFYSRKLWENVFKDPLVKESLEDKVLIGELDHPGDRLETKATNACIVMTDYKFNDQNGTLDGTFDILDTPNGRILKSLLDYGCKIGVSSRGEGDVTESSGVNNVDEESYYFVGFDAVVLPAVKKAKPALQESVKRESLKESLKKQISEAETTQELNMIKKVVEALNLPDIDSINESIDNRSKELEGTNSSSNLMEDLESATEKIHTLAEENKSLKSEVANCKSRLQRFVTSRVKMNESIGRKDDLIESLKSKSTKNGFEITALSNQVGDLTENLSSRDKEVVRLEKKVSSFESRVLELESEVSRLNESLENSQSANQKKIETINKLRSRVDELSQNLSESQSQLRKAKSSNKKAQSSLSESVKKNDATLRKYAEQRARDLGVNPSSVLESVKSGMTTKDVDALLHEEQSRLDRYRKVPVASDKLISALSESSIRVNKGVPTMSEEDSQTIQFMEQFYNQKKGT